MRKDATFISYGLLSGQPVTGIEDFPLPQRFHIRDRLEGIGSETWSEWFQEIWSRLRRSTLPEVTYVPLTDWRKALAMFENSGRQTKPVLDLR
ncbi:hypothetical protein J4G37_35915 [Microvirga sp. 3-52]|nr:hypothetical protein [Microvirga sp. 3-52]